MKHLRLWILLLLSPALSRAGVLFTYNCVNISDGTITLFRLDTSGSHELIEATTKDRTAATMTNHVCGTGVDVQPFLAAVKQLAESNWLADGNPPKQDPARRAAGDMLTVLLVTYNDSFVELRPLTGYTNIVKRFDGLIKELGKNAKKSDKNDGLVFTTSYIGTFDEAPVMLTDPYAMIGMPWLNKVFTPDEYDAMRRGGEMDKLTYSMPGRTVPITSTMTLQTTKSQTVMQDVK